MKQRAINSYFVKKTVSKPTESPVQTKRKAPTISSDEDDSPKQSTSTATKRPKTSKDASLKTVQVNNSREKLKPVDVMAVFGGETTRETKKQPRREVCPTYKGNELNISLSSPAKSSPKRTPVKSPNLLDTSKKESASPNEMSKKRKHESPEPVRRSSRTPKRTQKLLDTSDQSPKKTPKKLDFVDEAPHNSSSNGTSKKIKQECLDPPPPRRSARTPKKSPKMIDTSDTFSRKKTPKKLDFVDEVRKPEKLKEIKVEKNTPKIEKKYAVEEVEKKPKNRKLNQSFESPEGTKSKEKLKRDLETSVLSDEERFERKRMTAILYQKYKNRESVINPGSKEVPKGKPNCLAGLSFCVTGVLESIDRDEATSIIKELGGKISATVGKRLNYLVAGEESGPKKLATAEELGIPILSVDGLFDLIRTKSNIEVKNKPHTDLRVSKPTPEKKVISNIIKQEKLDTGITKIKEEKKEEPKITKIKCDPDNPIKEIAPVDDDNMAWVDKYKPKSVKQIIGQQGPASNCVKLMNWLKNWHTNQSGAKKLQKPSPWAKNDDGSYFKAALLSGPPGVGKTTTATLVCKELGFDVVEFNASDTRSKRLLKEEVSELLSNKSLFGYFHGDTQVVSKKHVLIMDEVDGMAGNEDRGGIQELIGLIKDAHVPIICMCNDRNHQKLRSLVNYCYDLRFSKPRLEQIKGFIKSICFKEKVKLSSEKIDEIILATNNDVRQSINHLCLLSAGKALEPDSNGKVVKTAEKDLKMGPWEVVRKVFSAEEHKTMSLQDKSDLFFHDYSMAPLFVQQNYLIVSPQGSKSEVLKKVAMTADALSLGDLVDRRIRSNSAWTLLPVQAVFSSVLPGEYMEGFVAGQINFPGWLGKYSRTNKRSRLAQEIHDHTRLRTSGSRLSIRMDYAPFLLSNIVRPLKDEGLEGVAKSLSVLQEYRLLREDIDSLIELTTWPGKKSQMDAVDGRVKAALTRAYNKEVLPYSYSAVTAVKKKKHDGDDLMGQMEGEGGETAVVSESDEDNDNTLENDNLIKAKVKPASKASAAKASTSKNASGTRKAKAAGKGKTNHK